MSDNSKVCVYIGETLGHYGFGADHPFGPDRMDAFWTYAKSQGIDKQVSICEPKQADQKIIESFHTSEYVKRVINQSKTGEGYLDYGDTPAVKGIFESAATVVGSSVDAMEKIMAGECRRAFVPIAGLHHARRDTAAGFCVFNDCGVVIEQLRVRYGCKRIAYVDIDAHHGDGVLYSFEDAPDVIIADMHEDGHYLYPGTGHEHETGKAKAVGTKLNIAFPPSAQDDIFFQAWPGLEEFIRGFKPEFILLQGGADCIAGDPITHLQFTPAVHKHAATRLCQLADEVCEGRLLAQGGGGYNRENLAKAWTAIVQAFVEMTG